MRKFYYALSIIQSSTLGSPYFNPSRLFYLNIVLIIHLTKQFSYTENNIHTIFSSRYEVSTFDKFTTCILTSQIVLFDGHHYKF